MIRRWAAILGVGAGVLALAGCAVSPQPEPPDAPVIDIGKIAFTSDSAFDVRGKSGAVSPGGAQLVGINLDDAAPEVNVDVDDQGRFTLAAGGAITSVVRLQAFADGLRSAPVDITGAAALKEGSLVVPANEVLGDCLHLAPTLELAVAPGGDANVRLTNECASDVGIDGLALRRGSAVWSVDQATPFTVAKGASRSFTVHLGASAKSGDEDVLLVDIGTPSAGTRALTLIVGP